MALNPSGAISLGGPVAGQSIALELGLSPTATISLNDTAVRTLAGVPTGAIIMPTNFYGKSTGTQRAIFAFGSTTPAVSGYTNITTLVSNTGVLAADTPGVAGASARPGAVGANYGGDKAIFAYGFINPAVRNMSNLVSNTGVMATDTPGVGTARTNLAAASYGGDKAIFGYGARPSPVVQYSLTNRVSNTGVVATDTPGVGTARNGLGAAGYGADKALFAFGFAAPAYLNMSNLVSNTGVVAANTSNSNTGRNTKGSGYSYT